MCVLNRWRRQAKPNQRQENGGKEMEQNKLTNRQLYALEDALNSMSLAMIEQDDKTESLNGQDRVDAIEVLGNLNSAFVAACNTMHKLGYTVKYSHDDEELHLIRMTK